MTIQFGRWGKNLAIRIPKELEERLRLSETDELEIEVLEQALDSIRRERARKAFAELDRTGSYLKLPPDWKFDREEANAR